MKTPLQSWILPALTKPNTWFVFREDGREIEIKYSLDDGVLRDRKGKPAIKSMLLRKEEKEYFNKL